MKKISLAAIILLLSAGLTLTTQAQTKAVNIEYLTAANISEKAPVALTVTPVYSKSGKLLYTVKRYEAAGLPKAVRRLMINEYEDFDIVGVEEVVLPSDNNSAYFVHIANDKKLKTVRVYNGESEVIKEFKKG